MIGAPRSELYSEYGRVSICVKFLKNNLGMITWKLSLIRIPAEICNCEDAFRKIRRLAAPGFYPNHQWFGKRDFPKGNLGDV